MFYLALLLPEFDKAIVFQEPGSQFYLTKFIGPQKTCYEFSLKLPKILYQRLI